MTKRWLTLTILVSIIIFCWGYCRESVWSRRWPSRTGWWGARKVTCSSTGWISEERREKKTANQFVLTLKGGDKELFSLDGSQLKVLISRRINSEVSQLTADLSTRSASLKTFNYYFFRRIQLERVARDLDGSLQTFLSSCDNNSSCGWMMDEWRDGNRIIQTSWTVARTDLSQPLGAWASAKHQEGTHLSNARPGRVRCMHTPACLAFSAAAWPLVVVVCRILLPRDYLHLALSPKQTLAERLSLRG